MKIFFIRTVLLMAGLTGAMMLPCPSVVGAVFADDVVIICNKEVPDNGLTQKDIRDIYLGKKIQWSDNSKIIFVTLKDSDANELFFKKYVGKTAFQFIRYWRKQLYSGKGSLPKTFEDEKELADYVANTQGAVGYVSAGADKDSVKIMTVGK